MELIKGVAQEFWYAEATVPGTYGPHALGSRVFSPADLAGVFFVLNVTWASDGFVVYKRQPGIDNFERLFSVSSRGELL